MTSSASPDPSAFYLIQLSRQTSNCIVALPGVTNTDYPIQVESCNAGGYYAQWQILSDGAGRYFLYNRGIGGRSQRLDFVQPPGYPLILIMGPSNDTYNNQRWTLNWVSDNVVRFTSYGLNNAWLSVIPVNSTISGVILQSTADVNSGNSSWTLNVLNEGSSSSSSSITITMTSTAEISTSTTAPVSLSSSSASVLQSLAISPSSGLSSTTKTTTLSSISPPTSTPTASPTSTPTASPASTPTAASGLTTLAKALVGVLVPLVVITLLVWGLLYWRKKRKTEAREDWRLTKQIRLEAQVETTPQSSRPHERGRVTSY